MRGKKKVFLVNGNNQYAEMFQSKGWGVIQDPYTADLVQFCGGSDVTPDLYDREGMPQTGNNRRRDASEKKLFDEVVEQGIPVAGICRGSQFLCVMAGHELYQHVDNHAIYGTHEAVDVNTGRVVEVTSTHHQMMKLRDIWRKKDRPVVLATAQRSSYKHYMNEDDEVVDDGNDTPDLEAVYFPNINGLAYQPHPEFDEGECRDYYFELLEQNLGL